jgi:GntR family transcriptional regulator, transcriptional repressor for pyruvate dehydrogenase complex
MPHPMFKPLEKKRYSDQIAEAIQSQILEQQLKVGAGLPNELALAQEFKVSRSVIREALRIMEISGLVKIKKGPTGGIFVSNGYHKPVMTTLRNMVTSGEVNVDHLMDIRLLVEPHIAMQVAQNGASEDIQKIGELIDDSTKHLDDPLHIKKNNLLFHLLLARAAGNPVMAILMESVFEILIEISLDFMDLDVEKDFHEKHQNIYLKLKQRRPKAAARLITDDIDSLRNRLNRHKASHSESS